MTFTESVSTAPPHLEALVYCFLLPVGVSYPALYYACFCDSIMSTAPLSFWSLCCIFWKAQCGVYRLTLAPGLVITQLQHELATAANSSYCITECRVATSLGAAQPKGDRLIPIEHLMAPDTLL